MAAISRITNGNFRLLHRLFVQIERILRINELQCHHRGCGRGSPQHTRYWRHIALKIERYLSIQGT